MPLTEIVRQAKAVGLTGVAICDHNRTLPRPLPEFSDFLLIPGVEVSTEYGHLLGLFVTKPVPAGEFLPAVDAIHAQGGLAVLAHPFERSTDESRYDDIAALLDGVEVWNARAERKNRRANAMADELAQRFRLLRFAGSDAHVPREIGHGAVTLEAEELSFSAVRKALTGGGQEPSGIRSRAWYVAQSQLSKRKKTDAGPVSYLKWGLFAGKCLLQDLLEHHGKDGK